MEYDYKLLWRTPRTGGWHIEESVTDTNLLGLIQDAEKGAEKSLVFSILDYQAIIVDEHGTLRHYACLDDLS